MFSTIVSNASTFVISRHCSRSAELNENFRLSSPASMQAPTRSGDVMRPLVVRKIYSNPSVLA